MVHARTLRPVTLDAMPNRPRFGNDLAVYDDRLLRHRIGTVIARRNSDLIGNSKLGRIQVQRTYRSCRITKSPGMDQPSKPAPDDHVAAGDYLCPGVHVPQYDNVTFVPY